MRFVVLKELEEQGLFWLVFGWFFGTVRRARDSMDFGYAGGMRNAMRCNRCEICFVWGAKLNRGSQEIKDEKGEEIMFCKREERKSRDRDDGKGKITWGRNNAHVAWFL